MRKTPPIRNEEVPALERAMAYAQRHLASRPRLPDMAGAAGMSRFHFHRRFKLHFGETPKAAVTRLQIDEARRLMRRGVPMRDVARACGFPHQSHFCSQFKRFTGLTPTLWLRESCGSVP